MTITDSTESIDLLKEHELDGYIPPEKLASKMQGKTKESGRFDKDNFKYNVEKDEFTCPNGETVKFCFEYVDKQNIGLRAFLTRGLQGVRAEFSLACIAHNLKRIWTIDKKSN